jgi:hypothetical protein
MTVAPILFRSLRDGAIFSGVVAVVAGFIGLLVSGVPGLIGGLLGATLSFLYLGLTAVSFLVAGRVTGNDLTSPLFFGIILAVWALKIVLFVVFAIWLRGQTWLDPTVFFVTVIIAVIGSLVLDMVAVSRTRVPYVSDVELPDDSRPSEPPRGPSE